MDLRLLRAGLAAFSLLLGAGLAGRPLAAQQPDALSGTVVDSEGAPLEGVLVDAWTWFRRPGNEARTAADGSFRLTNLGDNQHVQVQFSKDGYGPRHFFTDKSRLGGGADGWRVGLRNDTYLEGTLRDARGEPAAGVLMRARRGPFHTPGYTIGEVWTETTTDNQGRYRLHLEPDTYDLLVRAAGGVLRRDRIAVAAGDQRSLDLRLDAGLTFRAKVVDSVTGEPVEGVLLWNWQQRGVEGVSDAEGRLVIQGMSPGKFEFMVAAAGDRRSELAGEYARWWSPAATREHQRLEPSEDGEFQRNFDHLEFDIQPRDEPVTIYVEPCVTITGRVVTPLGIPAEGVTVAPAKTGSGNSITGDTRYSRRTNKRGEFTIKLPASSPAKYNLVAHDGGYQQWRAWANAVAEPIQTEPGQTIKGVTFTLNEPATATGRVVDAAGKPVVGRKVQAVPTDGLSHRYYLPETTTDAGGRFRLTHLRPGKHLVQVEPFWLYAPDAPEGTSQEVEVDAGGGVAGVEFRLPAAAESGATFQVFEAPTN